MESTLLLNVSTVKKRQRYPRTARRCLVLPETTFPRRTAGNSRGVPHFRPIQRTSVFVRFHWVNAFSVQERADLRPTLPWNRNRTCNSQINSLVLYQLSYPGIVIIRLEPRHGTYSIKPDTVTCTPLDERQTMVPA